MLWAHSNGEWKRIHMFSNMCEMNFWEHVVPCSGLQSIEGIYVAEWYSPAVISRHVYTNWRNVQKS